MTAKERCYLLIMPSGRMEIRTFDSGKEDVNDVLHRELNGGFYEIVRPFTLPHKFLVMVDDCGLLKDLEYNHIASEIYGQKRHGGVIVGPAVIMREDFVDGEPDIVGLTYEDVDELVDSMKRIIVITEVRE